MASASYQTIKLSRGKHKSPGQGACVMELASMLAGESYSDHPASVCPVIGSFLRAYNDSIDDDRRQDLYAYAAKVVGSNGPAVVQRARAEYLAAWALQMRQRHWIRSRLPARLRTIGFEKQPPIDVVGAHAVRSLSSMTDEKHTAALAVIDDLLAIGTVREASRLPGPPAAGPPARIGPVDPARGAHFQVSDL